MATHKQKKAAKKILENDGKSVSQAMREAGYSESFSKNPQQLTNSKGWKELMDKYISEEELLKTHRELLNNKKSWRARDAALDKAYKVLGKYKAEKPAYEDPLAYMSDEELDQEISRLEAEVAGRMNDYKERNNKAIGRA